MSVMQVLESDEKRDEYLNKQYVKYLALEADHRDRVEKAFVKKITVPVTTLHNLVQQSKEV